MVNTQPMPAIQRRLGSDRKANLLNRLLAAESPAFAPVAELPLTLGAVDEELSSSAFRSFEGDKLIELLAESRLFSFGAGLSSFVSLELVGELVVVLVVDDVELIGSDDGLDAGWLFTNCGFGVVDIKLVDVA